MPTDAPPQELHRHCRSKPSNALSAGTVCSTGSRCGAARPSAGCSPSGCCRRLRGAGRGRAARPLAVCSLECFALGRKDTPRRLPHSRPQRARRRTRLRLPRVLLLRAATGCSEPAAQAHLPAMKHFAQRQMQGWFISNCAPFLVRRARQPNQSIERTFQRPLRALWPAAHLQR